MSVEHDRFWTETSWLCVVHLVTASHDVLRHLQVFSSAHTMYVTQGERARQKTRQMFLKIQNNIGSWSLMSRSLKAAQTIVFLKIRC